MKWLREGWQWIRALRSASTLENGLDDELRFHLDQQTRKNLSAGMTPNEARRQALIRFGGVEHIRESTRDEFRPPLLEGLLRDLRYGYRSLRRTPGFTIAASFTLALGIGASSAVFSVVNGVIIKPLPYPGSEALISSKMTVSATEFFTWRDENRTLETFGIWTNGTASVTGLAEPEQVEILRVTHDVLPTLGVQPVMGRWFSLEDDTPGSPDSVILTNGYWRKRYGGDTSVIGRMLTVDSQPRRVIGVMPASYHFLTETADLILPFQFDRSSLSLGAFNYSALGRLKPGVTLAQANADVARMFPIWLHAWPTPPGIDATMFERSRKLPVMQPLKNIVVGNVGPLLWVLLGAIGIVLLIACANVANLLLVRGEGRQQELAVRAALGAGWARIARGSMVENLLLSLLGGAGGLALAFASLRLLVALGPASLPRLNEIEMDREVFSFALALSAFAGLFIGLISIVRRSRATTAQALGVGGRTSSQSRERLEARNTLVIVQVALALVLLVGSGLMIRTFLALRSVHPGFANPDQIELVRITIPKTLVANPDRVFGVQKDIRDRMAAIPGVSMVSFTSAAPMEQYISADTLLTEDQLAARESFPRAQRFKFVSPGYFQTVGTSLLAGRDFTWTDQLQRRTVVMISENMARRMWKDPASALGKRLRESPVSPWREIVGVVQDVSDDGAHLPAPMMVYWPPLMENFEGDGLVVRRSMTFAIRTTRTGSEGLPKDIQHAVWAVNPILPVAQIQTLRAIYERSLAPASFMLVMLVIAGTMALLLGLVGIYSVIAYAVTQRTREIGIRFALGAQPLDLERMFIRQGLVLSALGIVCGLTVAVWITRLMSSMLFGIGVLDPVTYLMVSVVLIAAAAVASYVPAHRVTTVDPMDALRTD